MIKYLRGSIGLICLISTISIHAQNSDYGYAANDKNPFGKLNPKAPSQVGDYEDLIGRCDCNSFTKQQDGSWSEPTKMTWTFKYIMNGTAIHDETLKADGGHTGSIRQFHPDSAKWYVHWFSTQAPTATLATWEGQERGGDENEIILHRPQKAPNGMDGFYKIRFFDISESGFNWVGAWTNPSETFKLETWKIECKKRKS